MIEITAEVRAAIDRAVGDMEPAGDEYIEPADRRVCQGQSGLYRQPGRLQPACH